MCKRIAKLIQGQHKPIYKRGDVTIGDKVIVVNCDKTLF